MHVGMSYLEFKQRSEKINETGSGVRCDAKSTCYRLPPMASDSRGHNIQLKLADRDRVKHSFDFRNYLHVGFLSTASEIKKRQRPVVTKLVAALAASQAKVQCTFQDASGDMPIRL